MLSPRRCISPAVLTLAFFVLPTLLAEAVIVHEGDPGWFRHQPNEDLLFVGITWGSLDTLRQDWYQDPANAYNAIPPIALRIEYPEHAFYVHAGGWYPGVMGSWQTTDMLGFLEIQTNIGNPPGSLAEIPADALVTQLGLRAPGGAPGAPWHAFRDNVTIGFGGHAVTFNFETPVPEPGSLLLPASGLALLALVRRMQRSKAEHAAAIQVDARAAGARLD